MAIETIKTSSKGNFVLIKRDGVGMNDTPYTELIVRSVNDADKYVVEIRLESDYSNNRFDGTPFTYKYVDVYISHGMRSVKESLAEIREYIEVLEEALDFVDYIKHYLEVSQD